MMGNTRVRATTPTVSKGELKWDFGSGGNVKLGVAGTVSSSRFSLKD